MTVHRSAWPIAAAALVLACLPGLATGQTAPPPEVRPETPRGGTGGAPAPGTPGSEGGGVARGVIRPPMGVDPGIQTTVPDPTPNTTPVIPPPGTPGGNPRVQPR